MNTTNHHDLNQHVHEKTEPKEYVKFAFLIDIIILITAYSGYINDDFSLEFLMRNFMGTFFLVFSLFKLLNLQSFVTAYSRYDVIAKRVKAYAYSYPFIELALAGLYLFDFNPIPLNIFTAILMGISTIGVVKVMIKNDVVMCACLGTFIKLPVTKITLVEDFGMGIMAIIMVLVSIF